MNVDFATTVFTVRRERKFKQNLHIIFNHELEELKTSILLTI